MIVADDWVVVIGEGRYPVSITVETDGYDFSVDGKPYALRSDWVPGMDHFRASLNGHPVCVQVERLGVGYRLFHSGNQSDVLVLTEKGAEFNALMPIKVAPDLSKFLLSPMPGLLVSIAVEVGQEVRAGEELAVVEAMKMENILRAERDGVVAALSAAPGDSLAVDDVILEFE